MAERTLNLKALSTALGKKPSQLSGWATRQGFPCDRRDGKFHAASAEEVRAWIIANIRERKHVEQVAASDDPIAKAARPARAPLANAGDAFIVALQSPTLSALDVSRGAMMLAARRVAQSALSGEVGFNELDDLKKTLQELRQAESGYIEIEQRRGQLIDREQVCEILGAAASRLVQAFSLFENSITAQMDLWISDAAFREIPTDDRRLRIREYVAKFGAEVRRLEAESVDVQIDAHLAEESGGGDAS